MPKSTPRKKPSRGRTSTNGSGERAQQPQQLGNPAWLVPTMLGLMLLGLAWIIVTYLLNFAYPIPGIRSWNLAIGFGFVIAGFALTTRWR